MHFPTEEIIRKRTSVRSFDGTPLRPEDLEKIDAYLAKEPATPFGVPVSLRLLDGEKQELRSPVLVGARLFAAGKVPFVPGAEEAFGYAFEKFLLFAVSLGLGTVWLAGTLDREAFERALELGPDERMPAASPLGYPAAKRSFRETMMRKGIKADSRLPFETLFFDGDFSAPLSPEAAGALRAPLEAVRLAPSAVNKQPWRAVVRDGAVHFYEKHDRGFVSDGWDIQKIDLGIAAAHFETVAEENGLSVSFFAEDPGLTPEEGIEYRFSFRTA